jgi:hypothetical protein
VDVEEFKTCSIFSKEKVVIKILNKKRKEDCKMGKRYQGGSPLDPKRDTN